MSEKRTNFIIGPSIKKEMENFPQIDWAQITESAIKQKLADLKSPCPPLTGDCQSVHWLNWTNF